MIDLLIKSAKGETITEKDLEVAAYEMCDEMHACSCSSCPVSVMNGGKWPENEKGNCKVFKNGSKILDFIRNN